MQNKQRLDYTNRPKDACISSFCYTWTLYFLEFILYKILNNVVVYLITVYFLRC